MQRFPKEAQCYTNMVSVVWCLYYRGTFLFSFLDSTTFIPLNLDQLSLFFLSISSLELFIRAKPTCYCLWLERAEISHSQCCDKLQLTAIHLFSRNRSCVGWSAIKSLLGDKYNLQLTPSCWFIYTDTRFHSKNLAHLLDNILNDDFITLQTLAQLVWTHTPPFFSLSPSVWSVSLWLLPIISGTTDGNVSCCSHYTETAFNSVSSSYFDIIAGKSTMGGLFNESLPFSIFINFSNLKHFWCTFTFQQPFSVLYFDAVNFNAFYSYYYPLPMELQHLVTVNISLINKTNILIVIGWY